jgi:tetratricopeptide (TPR) repeat protein
MGLRCSIGVATGRVYCGSVGGPGRQEYTIMGDRVNLAARLMQHADGGILADADTVARSRDAVRWSEAETLTVKGKSAPLEVRRPEGALTRAVATPEDEGLLIGRDPEMGMLDAALTAMLESGRSGLVYVEGEAGVGKSRLVDRFVTAHARPMPVRVLRGEADAIDRITPYHAFQRVILDVFGLHDAAPETRRDRVRHALRDDPAALEVLPLLDDILPMEFPETELTQQMTGEVRASNLQTLVVALLQYAATARPLLVVIDDAHWLDSASWELLRACVRQVTPLLAIVTGRPLGAEEMPDALRGFLEAPETLLLNLDRMEPEECIELVEQRLGVASLPAAVATLIRERGEGHPYFSEEIGYALRDSGALLIEDGRARLAQTGGGAIDLDLPDTIEGIITSRIDRLSPQQQLALKVASCIGRVFTTRVLHDIFPAEEDRATLPEELRRLSGLDLTPAESQEPEETWVFKHAITRQVAYDLMLYAQRKQLHRAIAEWYEHHHGGDLEPHYPLLAHHWSRAEDAERALHYLPLAAASALAANASSEAIDFVRAAAAFVERGEVEPPSVLERARWLVIRGRAENALGRLGEARATFEEALALVGHPVPGTRAGLLASIANQARLQARHRRRGLPAMPDDTEAAQRIALAAQTVERLFLIYVFANESTRALWTVLRATNLAEAIGRPTPVLIRCYTDLAAALTSIPLPEHAAYYAERAMDLAEEFPDDLIDNAWAHLGTAVCLVGDGLWSEVERRSRVSLETNRALGDLRRWEEASENIGLIRTLYGRFDDADDGVYMPLLAAARKRRIRQTEGWALSLWGMNLVYRQDFDALDAMVGELEQWLDAFSQGTDDVVRLDAVAVLAFHARLRGDEERLARRIGEGLALVESLGRPSQYRVLPGVSLFAETVIDAWRDADGASVRQRRRAVDRVLACVRTYAGIFGIGGPRLAWLEGRVAWCAGRERAALQAWRRALARAGELEMAHDAMLAARSLANCLPDSAAEERERCATTADALAEEMGIPGSTFACAR